MTTVQKITGAVVAVVLLVIILTVISMALPESASAPSEVTFSCVGVSTSSNTSSASIVISNPSSSRNMVYIIGEPEFKLNGVWDAYRFPMGVHMQSLRPGQSVTNPITASAGSGEARIPVLWGFPVSPKANKLQMLWEDFQANVRMHNSRGRGALYTNFVTGIKM